MKGNITRRGTHSWRVTFDIGRDPATRKRKVHGVTVHGTKREAQAELTRLMAAFGAGTLVEPSKSSSKPICARGLTSRRSASAVRPRKGIPR